ncbi:pilin [Patescibacteria group bacterium]|nr:pilin [Patescibacteria group bacterium]
MYKKSFISTISLIWLLTPASVLADDYLVDFFGGKKEGTLFEQIAPFLANTISFLLSIAGFVATIYIIYAGYLLVTSQGNEQQIETGKKALTGSIIGLVIALSGVLIINSIKIWLKLA